jgi:hypothetical protein
MNKKVASLLGLLLLSNAAQAELVAGDWLSEGDSQVTIDTDTGIEWLKLNNTSGMSVNQVIAELGRDGDFEGWRLPTSEEVQALIETVLPTHTWNDASTTTHYSYKGYGQKSSTDYAKTWIEVLGYTNETPTPTTANWAIETHSYGLHVEDDGGVAMTGVLWQQSHNRGNDYYTTLLFDDWVNSNFDMDWTNGNRLGVFLVSDGGVTLSSINDPSININNPNSPAKVSTPFAFGTILVIGMASVRRRKK